MLQWEPCSLGSGEQPESLFSVVQPLKSAWCGGDLAVGYRTGLPRWDFVHYQSWVSGSGSACSVLEKLSESSVLSQGGARRLYFVYLDLFLPEQWNLTPLNRRPFWPLYIQETLVNTLTKWAFLCALEILYLLFILRCIRGVPLHAPCALCHAGGDSLCTDVGISAWAHHFVLVPQRGVCVTVEKDRRGLQTLLCCPVALWGCSVLTLHGSSWAVWALGLLLGAWRSRRGWQLMVGPSCRISRHFMDGMLKR